MFLKTGSAHPELEKVCSKLDHINNKDMEVEMAEMLDPTRFLPKSKTFYTYPGSLTTPPLFEVSLKIIEKSLKWAWAAVCDLARVPRGGGGLGRPTGRDAGAETGEGGVRRLYRQQLQAALQPRQQTDLGQNCLDRS